MEVTTKLPIQILYKKGARRSNLIYRTTIKLIDCIFHRGGMGISSAITCSRIGYQIADGVPAAMATLDVATDPGRL